jgi:hypothetical protein
MRRRLRRREHGGERLHPRPRTIISVMTIGAGVDAPVPASVRGRGLRRAITAGGDALLSFF